MGHWYLNNAGIMHLNTSPIIFLLLFCIFSSPCITSLATRCVSTLKNYFSSPESNKCNQYEYCSQALKYYINVPCGDILAGIFKYIMKAQINIYQQEAFMLCKTVLARSPIILSSKQGNSVCIERAGLGFDKPTRGLIIVSFHFNS